MRTPQGTTEVFQKKKEMKEEKKKEEEKKKSCFFLLFFALSRPPPSLLSPNQQQVYSSTSAKTANRKKALNPSCKIKKRKTQKRNDTEQVFLFFFLETTGTVKTENADSSLSSLPLFYTLSSWKSHLVSLGLRPCAREQYSLSPGGLSFETQDANIDRIDRAREAAVRAGE
jgi:hypothetical protein